MHNLSHTKVYNLGLFEMVKHVATSIVLTAMTLLFFWGTAERSILQIIFIVVQVLINVCLKIWLYRSDTIIGQENLVMIKEWIGMKYAIKPE